MALRFQLQSKQVPSVLGIAKANFSQADEEQPSKFKELKVSSPHRVSPKPFMQYF